MKLHTLRQSESTHIETEIKTKAEAEKGIEDREKERYGDRDRKLTFLTGLWIFDPRCYIF